MVILLEFDQNFDNTQTDLGMLFSLETKTGPGSVHDREHCVVSDKMSTSCESIKCDMTQTISTVF